MKSGTMSKAVILLIVAVLLVCVAGVALDGFDDPESGGPHPTLTPWPTSPRTTTGKQPVEWWLW